MHSPDANPQELFNRVRILERSVNDLLGAQNESARDLQELIESLPKKQTVPQPGLLINGDFTISRNRYLYPIDVTGTAGVDDDVDREAAGWYTADDDTAVESTGSISAASSDLTLDTTDFTEEDENVEIVIEGAGVAGADLIGTIISYNTSSTVNVSPSASTTVANTRVRWRLRPLIEDSTDEDDDADPATNTTLKSDDHTLFATTDNDPFWDRENGWPVLHSNRWICQPLKQNIIRPSINYICSFLYKLDGADEAPVNFFAGIWDNSEGKRCFLEGDAIEITADVAGSPTATTSRTYFLVFYTNWGRSIGSVPVVVADAPTAFTNEEYVALEWTQPAGIIRTEIYRKTGETVEQLNPPYPQTSYKDKGATRGANLSEFPEVDTTRSIAYMETNEFNIAPAKSTWKDISLSIPVPSNYDSSKTTDKQWFVIGLLEELDPGVDIYIDRVSLDDKPGTFSQTAQDSAARRNISSTPTSGDIGTVYYGGGDLIKDGGTDYCPTLNQHIDVWDDETKEYRTAQAWELVDNERRFRIVTIDGAEVEYEAAISPRVQPCYQLRAGDFVIEASDYESIFTGDGIETKHLCKFQFGDPVLTKDGVKPTESILRTRSKHTVRITLKASMKGYYVGGIAAHNLDKASVIE